MLSASSTVERSNSVIQADIDGEVVMMSIDNGKYYGLDPIASHIWALIESPTSINTICSELLNTYDISEEKCQSDVLTFLAGMLEQKIITVS